ncbi:MAG: 2-octaprenyl-6-methoxyphenyl hydroxylase [Hyphomicrobiales bacterium]|nr:MAG: 2-octaprenyl-6-methoxyphenyl hydroxylase [Hyphomicrobiales bacterium]
MASALPSSFDVAVIGAGPAGMFTALVFAREGFDTALISPRRVVDDARTTALLDASVQMLAAIDLWPEIAPHAAPLRIMRLIDDTGRLIRAPETAFDSGELGLEAFGYNIANRDLNAELTKAVEVSGLTWIDASVSAIDPADDKVTITLDNGGSVGAKLIAGCDGRKSPSREAAGIEVRRWSYDQAALVANFTHEAAHNDTSSEFHTPTGPFTLVPLPGKRSSLVCVERPDRAEALAALDDDALSAEVERRAHAILGGMRIDGPRQVFPMSSMVANSFGANRIALIGEAAHYFPPIGAQGLNLSLRDAAALCEISASVKKQGGDIGGPDALTRYDRTRRPDVWSRTAGVDMLNRALMSDFLPVQLVRGFGLYAAGKIGPLRRLLMREGITPRLGTPRLARRQQNG